MSDVQTIVFDWTGPICDQNRRVHIYSEGALQKLKGYGYHLGVFSSASNLGKREKLIKNSGLSHYFDVCSVVTQKTQGAYLECVRNLGSLPENTLMVDDMLPSLIGIGMRAGSQTALVNSSKYSFVPQNESQKPTFTLDTITELPSVLPKLR